MNKMIRLFNKIYDFILTKTYYLGEKPIIKVKKKFMTSLRSIKLSQQLDGTAEDHPNVLKIEQWFPDNIPYFDGEYPTDIKLENNKIIEIAYVSYNGLGDLFRSNNTLPTVLNFKDDGTITSKNFMHFVSNNVLQSSGPFYKGKRNLAYAIPSIILYDEEHRIDLENSFIRLFTFDEKQNFSSIMRREVYNFFNNKYKTERQKRQMRVIFVSKEKIDYSELSNKENSNDWSLLTLKDYNRFLNIFGIDITEKEGLSEEEAALVELLLYDYDPKGILKTLEVNNVLEITPEKLALVKMLYH